MLITTPYLRSTPGLTTRTYVGNLNVSVSYIVFINNAGDIQNRLCISPHPGEAYEKSVRAICYFCHLLYTPEIRDISQATGLILVTLNTWLSASFGPQLSILLNQPSDPLFGSLILLPFKMANGGPQDPKSTYARSPDVDPILQNRLVGIADAYPGNPIVKWLVVPFARHPFK